MHLAESPGEMALLTAKRGPFVRFLEELGLWNPAEIKSTADEFLLAWADSKLPRLYVHGNYLPGETKFGPRTSICYCPRTHAAFGHPPHPFREWLDRGVNICLGTDSLASNPDLDILAEAKFLKARYPEIPSRTLLEMITISGARALGWEDDFGSLEPGKRADLIAIPLGDEEGDVEEIILIESQSRSGRVKRLST
jgi:imidazolonepropionase-like amidohydrolase